MSNAPLESLVGQLRKATAAQTLDELPDAELLARYQQGRDEAAFAALVRRHGRLISSACHQLLDDPADVDDVFQATFLVFVREAKRIRDGAALGGWLYRVAYRIALRLRQKRRKQFELVDAAGSEPDLSWRDACAVLHAELDRLPDKFRLPLVLCYLDGRSRDEAAKQLGWSEGMVKGRLERGRNLLRSRLLRRGVSLSAGLLAALSAKRAEAITPQLVSSVVELATKPPARTAVLALAEGVPTMMNPLRKWLIAASILFVGLLGAGAWLAAKPAPADPPAKPEKPVAEKPDDRQESRIVKGRIVDPDGKPVAGARLYWPTFKVDPPRSLDDLEMPQCGTSGKGGEFRVELPADEKGPKLLPVPILVVADGFGLNWIDGPKFAETAYTVRLPKSNPISGRVIDTQGKPLAGLIVEVTAIAEIGSDKLNEFLQAWIRDSQTAIRSGRLCFTPLNKVLGTAKTDAEGRFELGGVGVDHVAEIQISGSGAAQTKLCVLNHPGFDPKPINRKSTNLRASPPDRNELLYSPKLEYVAATTKSIEGVVTDAVSGTPVPGVRISTATGYGASARTTTDKQGHYKLAGVPKRTNYHLSAQAPIDQPALLARTLEITDRDGFAPIKADFVLDHGVILMGRVIDQSTGKGVRSVVRYAPLPDNAYFDKKPGYDAYRRSRPGAESDSQGRFKLAVIPGVGVLMAQSADFSEMINGKPFKPYLVAEFSEQDAKRVKVIELGGERTFAAAGNALEFLRIQQAVRYVVVKEDAGTVNVDLFVYRGKTRKLKILDPDGKPLDGATVSGMAASLPIAFSRMKSECTIYALTPKESRLVVVYHPQRKLGGLIKIDGLSEAPITIKLAALGGIKGQLVDPEGQPLAGVTVSERYAAEAGRELIRQMQPPRPQIKTDAEGRFEIEGVVPGLEFGLELRKDRKFLRGGSEVRQLMVESGQVRDLKTLQVKTSD